MNFPRGTALPQIKEEAMEETVKCPQCGKYYKFYMMLCKDQTLCPECRLKSKKKLEKTGRKHEPRWSRRELAREPTLYYWEVPKVAAGYENKEAKLNEFMELTQVALELQTHTPKIIVEEPNVWHDQSMWVVEK